MSSRVLAAAAQPTIGHDDPAALRLKDEVRIGLRRLFRAPDHYCVALPGSAAAGMEAALLNLLEPGETAVIAINGVIGERMARVAERAGAEVVRVDHGWGEAVDPSRVEAALWARGAKLLGFVQAESSTGAHTAPGPLCAMAREHGALSVVDCVTALGGMAVDAAEWGADALCAGTQQCLSAPFGLALIALGSRARDAVARRRSSCRTWSYDLDFAMPGPGGADDGRDRHPPAPVNALYGLHEAMTALFEEGLEASFARHARVHRALVAGLESWGIGLFTPAMRRLPMLNVVVAPSGVDAATVRTTLRARFGVEIGGGLGPLDGQAWRIGLMGASATPRHVRLYLAAMGAALAEQGFDAPIGPALAAAEVALAA